MVTKMDNEPGDKSAIATTVADNVERSAEPRPSDGRVLESRSRPAESRAAGTIDVDDSHLIAGYANFCRVSSTPEELILDLGLNPQPMSPEMTTIKVTQRIIMNHFTAKRLLAALSMALQRHESTFGVLETDVRRRVRGG